MNVLGRIIGICILCLSATALAETWHQQLDLPVMIGLQIDQTSETIFETASGRVIAVEASGPVAPDDVQRYYAEALPELGWLPVSRAEFQRDDEILTIEITRRGASTFVAFRLAPR